MLMFKSLLILCTRYLNKNWIKIIEAGLVAMVSAAVAFGLMVGINDCTDKAPFDSHAVTAAVSLERRQINYLAKDFCFSMNSFILISNFGMGE